MVDTVPEKPQGKVPGPAGRGPADRPRVSWGTASARLIPRPAGVEGGREKRSMNVDPYRRRGEPMSVPGDLATGRVSRGGQPSSRGGRGSGLAPGSRGRTPEPPRTIRAMPVIVATQSGQSRPGMIPETPKLQPNSHPTPSPVRTPRRNRPTLHPAQAAPGPSPPGRPAGLGNDHPVRELTAPPPPVQPIPRYGAGRAGLFPGVAVMGRRAAWRSLSLRTANRTRGSRIARPSPGRF